MGGSSSRRWARIGSKSLPRSRRRFAPRDCRPEGVLGIARRGCRGAYALDNVVERVQILATSLRIQTIEDRRTLKQFLLIPARLYAADPNWVPPLLVERLEHLNPRKNPYFEHA